MGEEFGEQFECLAENAEKYITFSIPIKKKLENGKINTNRTNFIDSFTFMSSSLTSLVDNLSEGLHNLDNLSEGLALNTISLRIIS